MTAIILAFETQKQADNAVLALSKGYKVVQWFGSTTVTTKPYHVKIYVPNDSVVRGYPANEEVDK